MDAASGAAVLALNVLSGDHVLDLCAAPGGANSEHSADRLLEWTSKRTWKDRRRASKARNGTDLVTSDPELIFYGRHSGVVGLCRNQLFRRVDDNEPSTSGYDKVLVDAECTHDGSIKHIQKYEFWGWKTLQRRVLDAERTDNLLNLQLQLLTNGFRLLRVGGSLVYSTCSLTVAQNEGVVEQFLSRNPSAELQQIDIADGWPCRSGRIPKTLRFDPTTSQTSGLFIAKIFKLAT
ncbi:putative methyltransferase NSUN3 [Ananas comosus]|uniref:Putative methyltransferase NSUN3 n=1 Tax=Ananas comosus TaxID=4615 RepID=A0A199UX80_ANACO|nr:putative methyltransferase NSUN3 [Ananas comosus]